MHVIRWDSSASSQKGVTTPVSAPPTPASPTLGSTQWPTFITASGACSCKQRALEGRSLFVWYVQASVTDVHQDILTSDVGIRLATWIPGQLERAVATTGDRSTPASLDTSLPGRRRSSEASTTLISSAFSRASHSASEHRTSGV